MDLNLLTIARRANLDTKINRAFDNANKRIEQIENITDKITNSSDFNENEKLQSREFAIIGLVSITELLLNEILHQVLISYPTKFGSKKFEIDELVQEGSILELFYTKANQKILDLAYGRFDKFIKNFKDTLELTNELDANLIEFVNEIKCTRDCLIHSEGRASDLYFSKVGKTARVSGANEKLKIDTPYYKSSVKHIKSFLNSIQSSIPKKILDSKKSYIFKQMWESTCLNFNVKFDEAWEIKGPDMVRPKDIKNEYGFSSSELVVYNFFRHIYNHQNFNADFAYYFYRWKPQTNEYQIAISWLDNQFYF